jgi:hypothetical protein
MAEEIIIVTPAEEAEPPAPAPDVIQPLLDHEGRLAALEERVNECLSTLNNLQSTAEEAATQAQIAQERALEAESIALEATSEPRTEEPEEAIVEEIPSEPEPENAGDQEKSTNWLENLLALR